MGAPGEPEGTKVGGPLPPVRIGVFDSGVGGLSVLREISARLPDVGVAYVADSRHAPYGTRPPEFIRERSLAIARFLVDAEGARLVVVACNTATTHAADMLRRELPMVPIVAMEPAIKPAAAATRTGVVGVLATEATLAGDRFATLAQRFTHDIELLTQPCPGLVERVERGDLDGPETLDLIRAYTAPMLSRGVDTIVLGCTHYPFLRPALQSIVGPSVTLIDTGPAVARQVAKVLDAPGTAERDKGGEAVGALRLFSSADLDRARRVMSRLWGAPLPPVEPLPV